MKALYAAIDDHIKSYQQGTITISEDIEFSMYNTVRQITHYILSKYFKSEQGRFRNIGNAIVDLEWRAKNIDRKSIEAHAVDGDHLFSLIVNKELQQWMKTNNFGKTIDDYQRKKSEYGSVMLKKTETADELLIQPVQWESTVVDPEDIKGGLKLETSYLTPLDLKKKAAVWTEEYEGELAIDAAITAAKKSRAAKDGRRIEVLDIEGEFEYCDIYPDEESSNDEIALYNIIVAVVSGKKYCLYKKKLKGSRFKHDARKQVEGRDMGLGVWEECFEAQIATNENVLDEREAMSLGGKVVITTNKKNLPTGMALMNGEVIDLDADEFFKPVSLAPTTLPQYQNIIDAWFVNTQRDQSAYPGMTGEEPKASTPALSLQLQAAQGASIFNKRRDQDAFFLLEVIEEWVLPFVVKRINKGHTLTAAYSPRELAMLDEAIRNAHVTPKVVNDVLAGTLVTPDMHAAYHAEVDAMHGKAGNKRTIYIPDGFITLKKIDEKVRFDITDEMADDQRRLNALATTLGALDPADPQRAAIIEEMMEVSGISAATFPISSGGAKTPTTSTPTNTRTQQVLPEGQKA
ncbi:hypothetical protein UNPF46_08610 [Bradyrhizobium sp. UNPF46]|uniref:hypothetical protein n=1 Tax=Bradyrhizobium sp. UNPF46 TaxID=1141168 RepID=UPI001150DE88|nr:hypothetical protein [Bradyrhizobium sp. UNPF46]TQF41172.1 hypothetical protein UNPF46_08610 [Bradyrhizobium sp. UNPF46]